VTVGAFGLLLISRYFLQDAPKRLAVIIIKKDIFRIFNQLKVNRDVAAEITGWRRLIAGKSNSV